MDQRGSVESGTDRERLLRLLIGLMTAERASRRAMLLSEPLLLSARAEALLGEVLRVAEEHGQMAVVADATAARILLTRARAVGAAAAIGEEDAIDRGASTTAATLYGRFDAAAETDDPTADPTAGPIAALLPLLEHPDVVDGAERFRALVLSEAARVIAQAYERHPVPADIDTAMRKVEQARTSPFADGPDGRAVDNNLGAALRARFGASGSPDDLDRAIAAYDRAATIDDDARAGVLQNLVAALEERHRLRGDVADLDRALLLTDNPGTTANLRWTRYTATGDDHDLDEAVHAAQAAADRVAPGDPARAMLLNNLGVVLQGRYHRRTRPGDLEAAVAALTEAAVAGRPDDPLRPERLSHLATVLWDRYQATGAADDRRHALAAAEESVAATGPRSPGRDTCVGNLAGLLSESYAVTGDPDELDRAVTLYREAATGGGAVAAHGLGTALLRRFEHAGATADLEAAIDWYRAAVDGTPPESPDMALYLSALANGLNERYHTFGAREDLRASTDARYAAVARTPVGAALRPRILTGLGAQLFDVYEGSGKEADLRDAIAAFEEAVACHHADAVHQVPALTGLGVALRQLHQRTGSEADLRRTIAVLEQAASEVVAPRSPHRPAALGNLGNALGDQFRLTGVIADLERSLAAHREALANGPVAGADRALLATNLGLSGLDLFARNADPGTLTEALDALEQAVAATAPDSPHRPVRLAALARGLVTRYDAAPSDRDLDRAIELLVESLATSAPDRPGRHHELGSLGSALARRAHRRGNAEDLVRAIELDRQALDACPAGSPHHAGRMANLAVGLRDLALRSGRADQEQAAVVAFRAAAATSRADVGLAVARNWGWWAIGRGAWAEAAEAVDAGMRAVATTFQVQLIRNHRASWLRDGQGVAAAGAYAAVRSGDGARAAELLERGRALMLSEVLQRDRAELDRLPGAAGADLARRYRAAAAKITVLESTLDQAAGAQALPARAAG